MTDSIFHPADILAHAITLQSTRERDDYLTEACQGDAQLRSEIERLLACPSHLTNLLEKSASDLTKWSTLASELAEFANTTIAGYRIGQLIGFGGFADVYEAESPAPDARRVALKVLHSGSRGRETLARFQAEQQTLSNLRHPNIAEFMDAGLTPDGRPFIVMELVDGPNIVQYCHNHDLTVTQKLELFVTVCRAVEHAHYQGIIHRDLKPDNILVTFRDGIPTAKVIDFGISKVMGADNGQRGFQTRVDQSIGTPYYMSPEQAHGPLRTDTRSDIYSLGVVLYELLAGDTPVSRQLIEHEVMALLRRPEAEIVFPPPIALPSTTRREHASGQRSSNTRERLRQADDLNCIVLKAIDPNRNLRYQSVTEFVRDLMAYQHGEPILAKNRLAYDQLKRLVYRHRRALGLAVAIVATLLAASPISIALAIRASRAEQEAVASAQRANAAARAATEARRAEKQQYQRAIAAIEKERSAVKDMEFARAVSQFLKQNLLPNSIVGDGPVGDIKLKSVLDHAAVHLHSRVEEMPLVEAASREALATAYIGLTEYASAETQILQALAIRETQQGYEHVDTLHCQHLLAELRSYQTDYPAAEAILRKLLPVRRRVLGTDNAATLTTQYLLGSVLHSQNRFDEALQLCEETLTTRRRALGLDHADTLLSEQCLAATFSSLGRIDEAAQLFEETCERHRRVLGPDHAHTLSCQSRLSDIYQLQKKYDQAAALYETTLASQRRVQGDEHHHTLVTELNLASVYAWQQRYEQSESLFRESIDRQIRAIGPGHPVTLKSQSNLAKLYHAWGRIDAAKSLYKSTVAEMQRSLGTEHEHTIVCLQNLAILHYEQGELGEAQELFTRTLEFSRTHEGAEHRHTLDREARLATVYRDLGKYAEARELFEQTLPVQQRTLGAHHPLTLSTQHEYARLLVDQQDKDAAMDVLRRTLSSRCTVLGEAHPDTIATARVLAELQ